jgi:uncharacterized membrane protein (UPF0127 family)
VKFFGAARALLVLALLLLAFPIAVGALQANDHTGGVTLPWTWTLAEYRETATITVGEDELTVEIADDGSLRSRGLSYRDGLEPGTGMLFIYPDEGERSFWMRGMRFCLDIVWIADGEIVGAAENACPEPGVPEANLSRFLSPEPVQFVLEVPAGWLDERGYGAGTPVDLGEIGD